jgi:hypothetical protein
VADAGDALVVLVRVAEPLTTLHEIEPVIATFVAVSVIELGEATPAGVTANTGLVEVSRIERVAGTMTPLGSVTAAAMRGDVACRIVSAALTMAAI